MRIGIFETTHFEVAYTLIRLFNHPDNQLTVFCYVPAAEQLKYLLKDEQQRFNWVIRPEAMSKAHFVRVIRNEIDSAGIEMLLLDSVEDNFIHYARMVRLLPGVRTILTLHDINNYFEYHNNGSLRRFVRNYGKKRLVRAVHEFTVLSSTLEDALCSKLPAGKIVRNIPGAIFDETQYRQPGAIEDEIHIVVPGTVDEKRRNYDAVFNLLDSCHQQNIKVKITLLGGISNLYGSRVLGRAKAYRALHNNLYWYESEIVEQPEFDRVMQESHFIFSPTVVETVIFDDVQEKYGITKSSGNVGDMIRFARPAIVPKDLRLSPEFSACVMRYEHINEIPDQLAQIRDDPSKYIMLKEAAYVCSLQFRAEVFYTRYPDLFTKAGS
ncbi:hypothetical protein [Pseudobacter ginsenosidimutans]|uniref:Glycosyltransferase involved in cell wall biosynthesis n=1 Tax=Pseudobacter ginsenosidimutans TaxID=661488 RepID=A0A4Q7N3Z9_9BACT|nr:hypothetical protein [Pseudobacter ginsenosidimutans]QEC44252.1 glycosyltransferase family 4 protein [Pseudobacter ginsenosidimutans]RZS75712.1 hypothetical protein EV199_1585 [Pseudobacter ginsenosidimutans]